MRTCPNCGKDTEADMTAACTECGWSPVGPGVAGSREAGSFQVGESGTPTEPTPAPSRPKVGAVWIVLILIGLAWQAFNVLDGCGEIFDENRNASANSVTVSITNRAEELERSWGPFFRLLGQEGSS